MSDGYKENVILTEKEHQRRLRRWILYLWEPFRVSNRHQTDLARALDISKQTVGDYLSGDVLPGFECFLKMHFHQGLDPLKLLREEPPQRTQTLPTLHIPTETPVAAQKKRTGRRRTTG